MGNEWYDKNVISFFKENGWDHKSTRRVQDVQHVC